MNKFILTLCSLSLVFTLGFSTTSLPQTGNQEAPSATLSLQQLIPGGENFQIDHGAAGPFAINAAFPGEGMYMGYELVRREVVKMGEGEEYTQVTYECMRDGQKELTLFPNLDSDGSEGALIAEIHIHSANFITDEGIGVGSTIDEFFDTYEDANAFYTYVSGFFWLDTQEVSGVQFMMNEKDYSVEPGFDSDLTELDRALFKDQAKIAYIRLY